MKWLKNLFFSGALSLPLGLLVGVAAPVTAVAQEDTAVFVVQGTATPPSYTGPGDVISYTAFWGLRAYTGAIVTAGTQTLVNLRRASDSHTCDILVGATGGLGNTSGCSTGGDNGVSELSWETRGTFSGTTVSTALTTSGDACTAIAGDQIIGAGITSYTKISSVTSCAAGVGHYVLSQGFTISVSETMTDLIATFVTKAYDQTGGGRDISQATSANQAQLALNCLGSLPCWFATTSTTTEVTSANFTPATGSATLVVVAERTAGTTGGLVTQALAANRMIGVAANTWQTKNAAGGTLNGTANDSAWHVGQSVFHTAGGTVMNIDNTQTTGTVNGNSTAGTAGFTGGSSSTIFWAELGFIDNVQASSGQQTSICHNAFAYWGTSTSC